MHLFFHQQQAYVNSSPALKAASTGEAALSGWGLCQGRGSLRVPAQALWREPRAVGGGWAWHWAPLSPKITRGSQSLPQTPVPCSQSCTCPSGKVPTVPVPHEGRQVGCSEVLGLLSHPRFKGSSGSQNTACLGEEVGSQALPLEIPDLIGLGWDTLSTKKK